MTYTTDCPGAFESFWEGYYLGVGGYTEQFGGIFWERKVWSFFWGIMDPSGLMGRLSKIKSKIEKSRFWHFLYAWSNDQTFILKYHFFIFFLSMGLREIDTDKIRHHEFGILGTSQTFSWQRCGTLGHWSQCPNYNFYFLTILWCYK